MSMQTLLFATLGGLISCASTALGSVLTLTPWKGSSFSRFKISIDFALGLMLSAVAFSLVGPTLWQSLGNPQKMLACLVAFAVGAISILAIARCIERTQGAQHRGQPGELLLAVALIAHNFPEGLASGAALAGLPAAAATPILSSIAVQNVPEGFLMVACLRALGWSHRTAFVGGLTSGFVELLGGVLAGMALSFFQSALPLLLMAAGGAMLTSVVKEVRERHPLKILFREPQFAAGLLVIPTLSLIVG